MAGEAAVHVRSLRDRPPFFDPLGEAAQRGISSATGPLFGLLWPSDRQMAARGEALTAQRLDQPAMRAQAVYRGRLLSCRQR